MRKLFLLLAAGLTVATVNAQQSQSVVLKQNVGRSLPAYQARQVERPNIIRTHATANKATATNPDAWFSFEEAAAASNAYFAIYPIYNDSSLYQPNGTPGPFFWYLMGLGTSFDPTSQMFNAANYNSSTMPIPTYTVTNSNSYTVDSVIISGYYDRKPYNNYVDTLNIWLAYSGSGVTGVGDFTYNADAYFYDNLNIPDSQLHFATPYYDSVNNTISSAVTSRVLVQKILDDAAYADSVGPVQHTWSLKIDPPMVVPAGGKVVAYQQYVSGHQYRFGVDIDSVNLWNVLTVEQNGQGTYPSQFQDDFNSGSVVTSASRYNVDTQEFYYQGQAYISSTYLYGNTASFDNPYFAFHINCTSCNDVAVHNVNMISKVNAYPNPAVNDLYIPFTLTQAAPVTITLTNALGQVIGTQNMGNVKDGKATFNVAKLPDGVYIYTVEANGQRLTGRTVVAH